MYDLEDNIAKGIVEVIHKIFNSRLGYTVDIEVEPIC